MLPPILTAGRWPARIPTALALLLFVSEPTHQGREEGRSRCYRQGWGARLHRREEGVDISALQVSLLCCIKFQLCVLTSKDPHSSALSGQIFFPHQVASDKANFILYLFMFPTILFTPYISLSLKLKDLRL